MTRNLKKLLSAVAMAGFLGGAGCLGGTPTTTTTTTTPAPAGDNGPGSTTVVNSSTDPTNSDNTASGNTTNTFDHDDTDTTDPFAVLARIQQEGPPEVSTRMHSCGKMKYGTFGNLLADLNVPITGGATTAGGLYTSGASALGKPDYANRIAESTLLSTAGSVRMYDIFVAAAPAVITGMPTAARCMVAGAATSMFDTTGATCTMNGITCLTGSTATQAQQDLCNAAVASNTTKLGTGNTAPTIGQVIAVASVLSAANSCE